MIRAFIFDLDGTLVDTEPLKNQAYARTALELSGGRLRAEEVVAVATTLIGVSLPETAMELVRRLGLEEPLRARMPELGVATTWEAFAQLQAEVYYRLLDEPGTLQRTQLAPAVSLLKEVRLQGCGTGLATMSYRPEVQRVLDGLRWSHLFDAVATADDVQRGKPDPDIYLLVATILAARPDQCLVLEDSPSGVTGALAAGMHCIAVPTALTRVAVHQSRLEERWIVDDPSRLRSVVQERLKTACESEEITEESAPVQG